MVNQEALDKTEELLQKYKYNWGKEPDLMCIPASWLDSNSAIKVPVKSAGV